MNDNNNDGKMYNIKSHSLKKQRKKNSIKYFICDINLHKDVLHGCSTENLIKVLYIYFIIVYDNLQ